MANIDIEKSIILVGMMGAGKTTVGRALAREIGVPFYDSDVEIETRSSMKIEDIFEKFGEDYFRQKECEVIRNLLDGQTCVLSTGGGAFIQEATRNVILQHGISVFLNADLETLYERVSRRKRPMPLLQGAEPYQKFCQLLELRNPVYAKADFKVDSVGEDLSDVVESVMKIIEESQK